MRLILHVTDACNLRCSYCFYRHGGAVMDLDTALAAISCVTPAAGRVDELVFFGGEPLLCRDLVLKTASWCRKEHPGRFAISLTTNGTLVDREYASAAKSLEIETAVSLDGMVETHDRCRRHSDGRGSYREALVGWSLLREVGMNPVAMKTVTRETVATIAADVKALLDVGVRRIGMGIDLFNGQWQPSDFEALRRGYGEVADLYVNHLGCDSAFSFHPFERRFGRGRSCAFGRSILAVSPDGRFFPCNSFVGNDAFCLGNVDMGVDVKRMESLFRQAHGAGAGCAGCALEGRCLSRCPCRNFSLSGSFEPSPILCCHERAVFPAVDRIVDAAARMGVALLEKRR